ncbi:IclR family transcriptional regulator [Pseudomonas sp. LD120]|uniref:IclR family transcriptional regulator n=1 Tax=Pseudomonas sp. LD120 TaxID=485751 RepID=UPI00135740B5|nr:IclR family transcriptional regulator [Pseudomonas sp. LD120]KAF0863345.1 helix-turn-helix domain-containing protein [Pseudomonas sp. LD120]
MVRKVETGSVRSVERALAIVELLGQHQALGLEELHYLTGLPKATVSRMLLTLQEKGWLYRGLSDRRYRLSARSMFGDSRQRCKCQLVEQIAPWLLELSARTGLVSDLSSFDGNCLEVLESAVPGVLRKRYPSNGRIVGLHASLFHSAMGKACLGALACDEVERLAEREHVPVEEQQQARAQSQYLGFGQRTEGHWEYPVRLPFLIRAVALPLRAEGRVIGSIALHWPTDLSCVEQVRNRHLTLLADTIEQVQKRLV